ncbi:hypothetical protein HOLleu_29347 [Holothuria leucospilota]|uniref:Death domain-containing protein n=1 Tax=Holothuria leucospilota TaxID=206669 RepID=A0A9Q1BNQ9_HOLLE|nr:hypothetical protein HOLleu_29347 [Holothuria leucospilota]
MAILKRPCLISHEGTINVQFEIGEKLTIMFMHKNKYAVYRESDGTIAILSNAEFQGTPPAMLDGSKYGALLNDVEFVLMYAVGKVEHCDVGGLRFGRNDVILILAHCNGTFVGITPRKKVGLFPTELVQPITKGRLCIFKGMVLKTNALIDCNTKKIYEGLTHEITKSSEGLFSWLTTGGEFISLHLLIEKSTSESGKTRPLPQPPQDNSQSDEVKNPQDKPKDFDEEDLYVEIICPDEHSQSESTDPYLQSDQGKQRRRLKPSISDLKGQTFSTPVSPETKPDSGLRYHLQSITSSGNHDFFKSFDEEGREAQKRGLLETLQPFLQTEVNNLIFYTVAGYLEAELFHKVGHKLGVPENRRSQIEETKSDVVERTIDLLDHWQQKEGKQATLGRLVDAVIEFDPKDILFILEELCEEVTSLQDMMQPLYRPIN